MLWEAATDPGSVRSTVVSSSLKLSLPFIDGPAVEHIWGAQKRR